MNLETPILSVTICYYFLSMLFLVRFALMMDILCFRGTFRMEREDGYTFDCRIPPFSLESKPYGSPASPIETV